MVDPRFVFFEIIWCCIVRDNPRVQLTKAMAYWKPRAAKAATNKGNKPPYYKHFCPVGNNEVPNPPWELRG